jgi:hypothetical protein
VLDCSTVLRTAGRLHPQRTGEEPLGDGESEKPGLMTRVRVCPSCSCCVDGLCRPGPSSGCPDALDSRWPYPCPCTSNTMDAPLP